MKKAISKVLIMGSHQYKSPEILDTIKQVHKLLVQRGLEAVVSQETVQQLTQHAYQVAKPEAYQECDLIIVVGGDGNIIRACHIAIPYDIPVVGINKGRLGFLADIKPSHLEAELASILDNQGTTEQRFLISATIQDEYGHTIREHAAINEVVLLPSEIAAHMISFSVFINDEFMCDQRADGIIVATPTGSTAYALSAGGPIVHPSLDALVLVPMFAHTLTSRPIMLPGNDVVRLHVDKNNQASPRISCDGKRRILVAPGHNIIINKLSARLTIVHPPSYNYFDTLRSKLGWN